MGSEMLRGQTRSVDRVALGSEEFKVLCRSRVRDCEGVRVAHGSDLFWLQRLQLSMMIPRDFPKANNVCSTSVQSKL